jgi:hypothetical protein
LTFFIKIKLLRKIPKLEYFKIEFNKFLLHLFIVSLAASSCTEVLGLLQDRCDCLLDSWFQVQGAIHEGLEADEAHDNDDDLFCLSSDL